MVAGKTQAVPKLGPILGGGRYGPLQAPTKLYEETLQSTVRGYVGKEVRKQETYPDVSISLSRLGEREEGVAGGKLRLIKTRALGVLSRAIENVSLMTALSCLITNNGRQLRPHFSKAEVAYIVDTCKKYEQVEEALEGWSTSKSLDVQNVMFQPEPDPNMLTVINMIVACPELVDRIGPPTKYATKTMLDFINMLRQLHDRMAEKFSFGASETRRMEKQLKEDCASFPDLRNNIKLLEREVQDQRNFLGPQLDREWNKIKDRHQAIEDVKEEFEKRKATVVLESEDVMHQAVQLNKTYRVELKRVTKETEEKYGAVLEHNVKLEKMQQKKRDKLEMQLAAVLAKYDEHIGRKHAEYEVLCESYDAEKAVMNELTKKLEEEQELYETLMAEREEERMRLFEEDAYNFLLNRSARRIQRAWRDFVDRKKARKRAKLEKARLKKQKALERAERKAQGLANVAEKKGKGKGRSKKGKAAKAKGKKNVEGAASVFRGPDVTKALDTQFTSGIMDDFVGKNEDFGKEVQVDL